MLSCRYEEIYLKNGDFPSWDQSASSLPLYSQHKIVPFCSFIRLQIRVIFFFIGCFRKGCESHLLKDRAATADPSSLRLYISAAMKKQAPINRVCLLSKFIISITHGLSLRTFPFSLKMSCCSQGTQQCKFK